MKKIEVNGRELHVLPASEINRFVGYDWSIAEIQIANCGHIIVDAKYGDVVDDEYDLAEAYFVLDVERRTEEGLKKKGL